MKGQVFFVFFYKGERSVSTCNDRSKRWTFSRQPSESNHLFEFVQQQNKREIQLVFKRISDFLQEEELESQFINGNIWFWTYEIL